MLCTPSTYEYTTYVRRTFVAARHQNFRGGSEHYPSLVSLFPFIYHPRVVIGNFNIINKKQQIDDLGLAAPSREF